MQKKEQDFSFYDLFVPLTQRKVIGFIILLGSIVFFNALFGNFVWDDRTFIQFNPDVRRLDIGYLLGPNMFNNVNAGQYRFFVALYFTLLHTFFGTNVFFYHFFQIIIHIINAILVFLLFKHFFSKYIAFFLSLIFLVHPIQVESVSYIASSGNTFFVFFGLTALYLSQKKRTWLLLFGIFILLLFSMLSKETGVLFVLLIPFYRLLFQKKDIMWYVIFGISAILSYGFLRFAIGGVFFSKILLAPIARLDLSERLVHIPAVMFYYVKTFFLPLHLAIEQYWIIERIDVFNFYLPLLIIGICLGILLWAGTSIYKTHKNHFYPYLFFSIWTLLGLGMYSQLFALNMTVADRWFYFPIIGILGMLGIILQTSPFTFQTKKIGVVLMIGIITLLSLRTVIRNTDWKDPITLYLHDSAVLDNYDLQNSLGGEYNAIGQPKKALEHFKKSVDMFPHETNLFNLGLTYEQLGDKKTAQQYYLQAYHAAGYGEVPRPHRHHSVTYMRLAILLMEHNPQKAVAVSTDGTKDYPTDPQLWYVKALSEEKADNTKDALLSAQKAYTLFPSPNTKQLYERLRTNSITNINK